MSVPKIVIAGTNSGCGKTTISMGIMSALTSEGLKVQPFKVGPDYIDPMFHTCITGNPSRNLDSWMLDETTLSYIFSKNASNADIAVIEGVMGLYDGYGANDLTGSTAHVAKIVEAPVILVVNGEGMSLSIVPIIKGFMDFDKDVKIKGVIINNVKSEAHFRLLKNAIETYLDIAVVGYLKNMPEIKLESRHLGLIPQGEIKDLRQKLTMLSGELKETVDLVLLRKIADENVNYDKNLPDIPKQDIRFSIKPLSPGARIAVAKDQAFNFYYQDNLDLLEMLGAELVYFSPLNDNCLPEGINGLYLGGGYPEIFAAQLEKNKGMMECIKTHITRGLPTYAECGGLMYLSEGIVTDDGEKYDMVGIVPGICRMTKSLQRFGYIEIEVVEDNILAERGEKIRGHEFHYSAIEVNKDVTTSYCISKSRRSSNSESWKCGFKIHNLLAGYPHIHFWSNPSFAKRFVENCLLFGKERNCL